MLHSTELILIMLAALAIGLTALALKWKKPYPILLVIAGAAIGLMDIPGIGDWKKTVTNDEFFREAVILFFLPALLGEASFKLRFQHLYVNRKPILFLAFGGTLLTFLIAGILSAYMLPMGLQTALVFAALMAATDPVSVLSIFKNLGADRRLSVIIEGESLFNDAVAFALFTIAATSIMTYLEQGMIGFGMGLFVFVKVLFVGALIGGALSLLFSYITKMFDDYSIEIIFALILFYASYMLAEAAHASGVIAVVTAGIIYGNFGARIGMSAPTKLAINSVLDSLALLANALVFFMVGLEITVLDFTGQFWNILLAIAIVLIARSIAVYTSVGWMKNVPLKWAHVLNYGGLKGSLSIALALSLPESFPGRENVLLFAFCVVFFSLVVQGLSIGKLVNKLDVKETKTRSGDYESLFAKMQGSRAILDQLPHWSLKGYLSFEEAESEKERISSELKGQEKQLHELMEKNPLLQKEREADYRLLSLFAQHEAIEDLVRNGVVSGNAVENLLRKLKEDIYEAQSSSRH